MTILKDLFKIEKNPRKGLMPLEWVSMTYLVLTLLWVLFAYTKVVNPQSMIWGRIRIAVITLSLWGVYRALPCRFMVLVRVLVQMLLLVWWYPDTYEINRMFPNLDYLLAEWEQTLFGFQPALVFAKTFPWPVVSELMDMGYFMYYPMIAIVGFYYFFTHYEKFERCCFIILTSFFIYYAIFIFFPAVGPTYYYDAVGIGDIAKGIFPPLHDYFSTHTDCLVSPGYPQGFFYHLVEDAKATGERPTAAFPSSHVGVSTICMLLTARTKNWKLFWVLFPIYVFLCLATVYIQAHYLIDAIAGLLSGILIYFILLGLSRNMVEVADR